MKNMKIKKRLIVAFLIVVALGTIIGVVGIAGLWSINSSLNGIYEDNLTPLPAIAESKEYLQRVRMQLRVLIIDIDDTSKVSSDETTLNEYMDTFASSLEEYAKYISNDKADELYKETKNIWNSNIVPGVKEIVSQVKSGDRDGAIAELGVVAPYTNSVVDNLKSMSDIEVGDAEIAYENSDTLFYGMFGAITGVLVISIIISIVLAIYIANLINNPLTRMAGVMNQVGKTGDLALSGDVEASLIEDLKGKDEIAECLVAFKSLYDHLQRTSDSLALIADGDLTGKVNTLSDRDTLGVSLHNMQDSLNRMFGDINEATEQVSSGANQVSDGAQALALGSTEQASAIEELSSSIEIIANKTKDNAQMANQAAKLSSSIKVNAETGTEQMGKMMQAVKEINEASVSISNVIKVIDDIAFQTNILALNAAVEAARAGQHGKGFAVVADEVRNLASKSAEAAKNTSSLIANSMEKAELGAKIADNTSTSLHQIVEGINESTELVGKIAASSEEQTVGITQINTGIEQVAQVVQQNSATAEESAAASEEMSGQATVLAGLVAQFKIK